jgi:hypothetical protein
MLNNFKFNSLNHAIDFAILSKSIHRLSESIYMDHLDRYRWIGKDVHASLLLAFRNFRKNLTDSHAEFFLDKEIHKSRTVDLEKKYHSSRYKLDKLSSKLRNELKQELIKFDLLEQHE